MSVVDAELKQFGSQIIIMGGNIGKDRTPTRTTASRVSGRRKSNQPVWRRRDNLNGNFMRTELPPTGAVPSEVYFVLKEVN